MKQTNETTAQENPARGADWGWLQLEQVAGLFPLLAASVFLGMQLCSW